MIKNTLWDKSGNPESPEKELQQFGLYFKAIPNSIDFYKEIFLYVIPVCIIVPKASSAANTKNKWFWPNNFIGFCKSIFLKTGDSVCVFKDGLTFKSFIFWTRCFCS